MNGSSLALTAALLLVGFYSEAGDATLSQSTPRFIYNCPDRPEGMTELDLNRVSRYVSP